MNGYPANAEMPAIESLFEADKKLEYEAVEVLSEPGAQFNYSGGGFMVLEHLVQESLGQIRAFCGHHG